jgi:hypothetical protein
MKLGTRKKREPATPSDRRVSRSNGDAVAERMRVLVCGGRDYDDRDELYAALDKLHAEHRFSFVIAGGAEGADTLARDWAMAADVPVKVYMANWGRLGPKAGPIHNQRMQAQSRHRVPEPRHAAPQSRISP